MSDEKPGAKLTAALAAHEQRRGNRNAAANAAREKEFIGASEHTREEHEAWQPRLKREMLARNPRLLGTN